MPDIRAIRGLRYDPGHVGSLSNVIAPPYDVIDATQQSALYDKHPANVVRLILNRDEPGDSKGSNRYTRAARFLTDWRREGILRQESDPAVYVYHQIFTEAGETYTRRGFLCGCVLERFGEGKIYPHELTMSGPKADRLLLTRGCRANLSPIFGLYPESNTGFLARDQKVHGLEAPVTPQQLLENAIAGQPPMEAADHLGVIHRLWVVREQAVVSRLEALLGPKPLFIADGHHRYETACNYRDELAKEGKLTPSHPANAVLMMFISMNDPGLIVLPTHRLFRGVPEMTDKELAARLGECFTTKVVGEGSDLAENIWEQIAAENEQGTMAFYTVPDQRWTVARITDTGRRRMAQAAPEQSEDWRNLGVSILHTLIIDTLLESKGHPKPGYVRLIDDFVGGLEGRAGGEGGREEGETFQFGALVMPATVDDIRRVSEHGERMPAKSTYFYPKLLSGLVINPLE